MFTSYYGYWEYWLLYHKVTFDGVNKLILINPGETTLDVKKDIYSAWKEWLLLQSLTNTKYLQSFSVVGGEPLTGNEKLDSTFFLINGWKLKPYSGEYSLVIEGNLFTEDGSSILVSADINENFANNIAINLKTSAVVRQLESVSSGGSTNVTASLIESQANQLTNIDNTVTSNANLLYSQSLVLNNLQTMLDELYAIHGLKIGFPVNVTTTGRTLINGTLTQNFTTVGTGSLQQTTITRTS